jgi:hypothetical protein
MNLILIREMLLVVLLGLLCFLLGFVYYPMYQQSQIKGDYSMDDNCTYTGNLTKLANCLENELSSFYNYNLSNTGKELNITQLKEEGGVCSHYSKWYISKSKYDGLYSKYVIIDTSKDTAHAVAILSDIDEYCLLDQTIVMCFSFEVDNGSEEKK